MEACGGFLFAVELSVGIAEQKLKHGVLRVLRDQRLKHCDRPLVFLVIVAQVLGQVEPGLDRCDLALLHGQLELAHALSLTAAWNTHEEAQDFGYRRKRIDVIVVEPETRVSVGQLRVKLHSAQKMLAGPHASASRAATVVPQPQQPSLESPANSRVQAHFGRVVLLQALLGQRNAFVGERQVSVVFRLPRAMPGVNGVVFDFARRAVDLPPLRVSLQEIAHRIVGLPFLDPAKHLHGRVRVAGVEQA